MGVGRGKRSPHERQRYAGVHLLAHANALRANASRASRMSLRSSGLHLLKRRLHGSIIHHNPPPTVPAVISGPRIHCAVRYSETRSASAGRASRVSPHNAGDCGLVETPVRGQRQFADLRRKRRWRNDRWSRTVRDAREQPWLAHLQKRRSSLRGGPAATVRFAASCFELARWTNRTEHGAAIASPARDA